MPVLTITAVATTLAVMGATSSVWSPALTIAEIGGKQNHEACWGKGLETAARLVQGVVAAALLGMVSRPIGLGFFALVLVSEGLHCFKGRRGVFEEGIPLLAKWINLIPGAVFLGLGWLCRINHPAPSAQSKPC